MPRPYMGKLPAPLVMYMQRFFGRGAALDYRYMIGMSIVFAGILGFYVAARLYIYGASPAELRARVEARGGNPNPKYVEWSQTVAASITCISDPPLTVGGPQQTSGLVLLADSEAAFYELRAENGSRIQGRADMVESSQTVYANLVAGDHYLEIYDMVTETLMQSYRIVIPPGNEGHLLVACIADPPLPNDQVCNWCVNDYGQIVDSLR